MCVCVFLFHTPSLSFTSQENAHIDFRVTSHVFCSISHSKTFTKNKSHMSSVRLSLSLSHAHTRLTHARTHKHSHIHSLQSSHKRPAVKSIKEYFTSVTRWRRWAFVWFGATSKDVLRSNKRSNSLNGKLSRSLSQ